MSSLTQVCTGVYAAETMISLGMGVRLPLRMTVLKTGSELVLVSPIEMSPELVADIEALGTVTMLIGPNRLHYKYLEKARAQFPRARLLGAPGLQEKCGALSFDAELASGPLCNGIESLHLEGADKLSEVVFWHRSSQTLVVTDAIFNIQTASGVSKFVLKYLAGTLGRFEQSRLVRTMTNDREATARSVRAMLEWPIERVVMAHGQVVDSEAAAGLRAGLWWWRQAERKGVRDVRQRQAEPA